MNFVGIPECEVLYRTDRAIVIQGDCRRIVPIFRPDDISLVLTDPPYGVSERTMRGKNKRSALAEAKDFSAVLGDDEPFDPSHLLHFKRLVLFGANYYAERLPPSPSWFVWDKLNGLSSKRPLGFNDNADVELAWTNLGGPARILTHRWMGIMKDSEHGERRVHPTQKPAALMRAIVEAYTQPDEWVLDPYCGSGSTLVGTLSAGRRGIAIDLSREYCERTIERVS